MKMICVPVKNIVYEYLFLILMINCTLGALCTNYVLNFAFGKNLFWYWDLFIGLFAGDAMIVFSVICFISSLFGVRGPLF